MSARAPRRLPLRAHLLYRPGLRHGGRHPVLRELARLEQEQWLHPEEVGRRHRTRLLELACAALATVPFYRQRVSEAVGGDLDMPRDFAAWPLLSRAELAQLRDELVSSGPMPAGASWNHTGGSTGEPVAFLQEDAYRIANLAAVARHDRWAGWDFGRPLALLWGADRDLATSRPWRERLETRWLRRQAEMDAFEMSPTRMGAFSARLTRMRPAVVRGYASALELYARHLRQTGRPFPAPRGVIACAETLSDSARALLQEVFECQVFDRYGSREFGLISSQCEAGRYHVNTRGVWVEILDGERPAEPGSAGRVVVTGLAAHAMPLVRYETGDVAEAAGPEGCPCGRGLPVMGRVHGRVSDFVVTADGRLVHGEFFTHLFYGCASVRAFALRQDARGDVTLSVTGEGEGLAAEVETAALAMRRRLGPETRLEIRHVDDLPPAPSGKRRFVVSELAPESWAHGVSRPGQGR